jgi:hypothetical protein
MVPSNIPAQIPERQPEPAESTAALPRPAWSQPAKRTPRFPIKLQGGIPT